MRAQRSGAEDRQIAVHGSDFTAHLVEQAGAGAIAQLEGNKSPSVFLLRAMLEKRVIQHGPGLIARAIVVRVFHHADDGGWAQPMADGILARESAACKRLIYDDHFRRGFIVAQIEIGSQQDRRPHRREIAGAQGIPRHTDCLSLEQLAAIHVIHPVHKVELVIHRTDNGGAGGPHVAQGLQPLKNFAIHSAGPIVGVAGEPGIQREHQHVVAVEADVHAPELLERAHEEPGARDQDHRKRNLGDDQYTVERMRRAAALVAAFLQRGTWIHARAAHRRCQAEEDPREQRHGSGKAEDAPIRMHIERGERIAGRDQSRQAQTAPPRHRQCQGATDRGKQHAFCEKLAYHSPSSCSQRQPYGDFAAPVGSARQQKVGQVGTRHQQHDARHPHQQL